jgi:hypothetical protein
VHLVCMGKLSAGSTGGIDMRYLLAVAFILSLGVTGADAAQCRDTSGKFMKCPPAKVVHCRSNTGKFVKCSAPGAKPA